MKKKTRNLKDIGYLMKSNFDFFHARFKKIARPERERVLCAMIRVNYGTPWQGDIEVLKKFFPADYHNKFVSNGLTSITEALSPFADEPTEVGFVTDEPTLVEGEITENFNEKATSTFELLSDIPEDKPSLKDSEVQN